MMTENKAMDALAALTEKEHQEGLKLLRQPFPENQISLLPRPTKKDNPKGKCKDCDGFHGLPAVHLKYVGHAALTDRLLDADPNWTWEPLALRDGLPAFDETGGLWIKLTVCGVTRLGYGHAEKSSFKDIGAREKEVIGDALRNAAMRFGAALELWHKGDLHVEEEDEKPTPPKPPNPFQKPQEQAPKDPEPKQEAPLPGAVPGEYVPKAGRLAGKKLKDHTKANVVGYHDWLCKQQKLSPEFLELKVNIEAFLENELALPPPLPEDDELPF